MTYPVRGGIYPYRGSLRSSTFLVVSIDQLNAAGTVVVVEVADNAPQDLRGLLAVQLTEDDPLPGSWALAWRINYANAGRFQVDASPGHVSPDTMRRVLAAIAATVTPL